METTEIIEGNKLIAQFMGATFRKELKGYAATFLYLDNKRWVQSGALKYHSSWDWLMPVTFKVKDKLSDKSAINFMPLNIDAHPVDINFDILENNIESCFQRCARFIRWYNSLTPSHVK